MHLRAASTGSGQVLAAIILSVSTLIAAFTYRPGLGGSYQFDDPHNLQGLSEVVDFSSALGFISSGGAGPLGRPVALASFAFEAYAWPNAPHVFLHTNVCLHLLNGVLLVWMLYLLGSAAGYGRNIAAEIAAFAGAIWMMLPILASSSLMVVQRMTVLSATFCLLGFVVYLYGRTLLRNRPRSALLLMTAGVCFGTVLAVLSKESGALLPAFILVSEATILRSKQAPEQQETLWRTWRWIFLAAPSAMLVGYLALQIPYAERVIEARNFTASDRFLSQSYILWEYLRFAFIPSESGLGPFHDHHPIFRDWFHPLSLAVVAAWIAIVAVAVACRNRAPLVSFGIAWFLVGHMIESTVIPLELYFEHRNYMPLMGPSFAIVALAMKTAVMWRPLARLGLATYTLLLAFVLFGTTSLWGRPLLAAEMWAIYNPDSRRAVQYLAEQYELAGDRATTRKVLQSYLKEHPDNADVALQILAVTCLLQPEAPQEETLAKVRRNLATSDFDIGVHPTLERLYRIAKGSSCNAVSSTSVYEFAALAASNPAFGTRGIALHNLHILMATITRNDANLTANHLVAALDAHHSMQTLEFAVHALKNAGRVAEATRLLDDARSYEPKHPVLALRWREKLTLLIDEATGDVPQ